MTHYKKIIDDVQALFDAKRKQPAQQRPQNCGTGYCSCIECLFEQPAQQQEPAAIYVGETWCGSVVRLYEDLPLETPLYTSPPASKPWVGLTDEEKTTMYQSDYNVGYELIDLAEAKLKEKNT